MSELASIPSSALVALALLAIPLPDRRARLHRLAALIPLPARAARRPDPGRRLVVRTRAAGAVTGVAVAVAIGGPVGVAVGAGAAALVARALSRLEPAGTRRLRERRLAALPDALSLLAASLTAGLPLPSALTAVAGALGGPLAPDLGRVADLCALGAGPAAAWSDVVADPALGPVARVAARSADSGSALAEGFRRLATETRADAQLRLESAARRAGVLAMAPLGLCFLPAFVCLGVVPTAIGLARQILH